MMAATGSSHHKHCMCKILLWNLNTHERCNFPISYSQRSSTGCVANEKFITTLAFGNIRENKSDIIYSRKTIASRFAWHLICYFILIYLDQEPLGRIADRKLFCVAYISATKLHIHAILQMRFNELLVLLRESVL